MARLQGADGVELDVRRVATGEVVVFHDRTLERLAGRPEPVRSLSFGELARVRLGDGQRIPTLAEVLVVIPAPLTVNVELKWDGSQGLARAAIKVIEQAGAAGRVVLSSFDPRLLVEAWLCAPHIERALLFYEEQRWPLRSGRVAPLVGARALHPSKRLVTAQAVRAWRSRGYAVRVWTVDDEAELRWLWALGVDAVITNAPARARRLYRELGGG